MLNDLVSDIEIANNCLEIIADEIAEEKKSLNKDVILFLTQNNIGDHERVYLQTLKDKIEAEIDDDIESYKCELLEQMDIDQVLEEIAEIDQEIFELDFDDIDDIHEVEENDVYANIEMFIHCSESGCNVEVKATKEDCSIGRYHNDVDRQLREMSEEGRMVGDNFYCNEHLLDRLKAFTDVLIQNRKKVAIESVINEKLNERTKLLDEQMRAEQEAQELAAKIVEETIKEEKENVVTLDRRNFIKAFQSNVSFNFS